MKSQSKRSKFFELLAVEVASGLTIKASSEKIGCALQTAYNISSDPAFNARVASIRSESVAGAVGKLSTIAGKAVDALESLLEAEDSRDRLNAAKAILATLGPLSELGELRARIDKIESSQLRITG